MPLSQETKEYLEMLAYAPEDEVQEQLRKDAQYELYLRDRRKK